MPADPEERVSRIGWHLSGAATLPAVGNIPVLVIQSFTYKP
jgi:hypothetical protein